MLWYYELFPISGMMGHQNKYQVFINISTPKTNELHVYFGCLTMYVNNFSGIFGLSKSFMYYKNRPRGSKTFSCSAETKIYPAHI